MITVSLENKKTDGVGQKLEKGFNPLSQMGHDQIEAYTTCRLKCNSSQMNRCDADGVMPGMRTCRFATEI